MLSGKCPWWLPGQLLEENKYDDDNDDNENDADDSRFHCTAD